MIQSIQQKRRHTPSLSLPPEGGGVGGGVER